LKKKIAKDCFLVYTKKEIFKMIYSKNPINLDLHFLSLYKHEVSYQYSKLLMNVKFSVLKVAEQLLLSH